MILVCPSCDSKFKVPDNAIPPAGRKVRCAKCGNSWHATRANQLKAAPRPAAPAPVQPKPAEAYVPPAEEVDAGMAARAAAIRRSVVEEAPAALASDVDENLFDEGLGAPAVDTRSDDGQQDESGAVEGFGDETGDNEFDDDFGLDGGSDEDDDYDDDDIVARRRGELRRDAERRSLALKRRLLAVGWASLLIFVLLVLGAVFFMKDTVTATFPGTNQLYDYFASSQESAIYSPPEGTALSRPITETEVYVRAELFTNTTRIETVDGQQVLVIRGQVENTGNRAANVPQIEISIKTRSGQVLDQWIYEPPGLVLRRLSKLPFETTRFPVPSGIGRVEVRALEGTRSSNEAPSQL